MRWAPRAGHLAALHPAQGDEGRGRSSRHGGCSVLDEQIRASSMSSGALGVLAQPAVGEGVVAIVQSMKIALSGKRLDVVAHAGLIRLRRLAS